MSTEARDMIEQLIEDGGLNYVLGWLGSCLDGGQPVTVDTLREAVAAARVSGVTPTDS